MSAKAAVCLLLLHFAEYRPEATLAFDRDVGALTPRVIEVGFDAAVLGHDDFGVCGVSSRYASQAQRVIRYEGRHKRLDNQKICVAVDNQSAKLLLQISIREQVTSTLKRKLVEAHHLEQVGQQLFLQVSRLAVNHSGKITGMLLELPDAKVRLLLIDEPALKEYIHEAVQVLQLAEVDGGDGTTGAGTAADAAKAAATGASANPTAGEVAAAGDEAPGPGGPWQQVQPGGRGRGFFGQVLRKTVGTRNSSGALASWGEAGAANDDGGRCSRRSRHTWRRTRRSRRSRRRLLPARPPSLPRLSPQSEWAPRRSRDAHFRYQ
jgi:hypothetical protein